MTIARESLATGGRRVRLLALALVLLAASLAWTQVADAGTDHRAVVQFHTMVGVPQPLTGAAGNIRGFNAGGAPWVISDAKGELRADGDLKVDVKGLVIATTGVNPVAQFKAVVSCLTLDANNALTTVNVATDPVPASPEGDAKISATVDLPDTCIAPIVFVTNPNGAWFAATGF